MKFLPTEEKVIQDIFNEFMTYLPEEYKNKYEEMSLLRLEVELRSDLLELIRDEVEKREEKFKHPELITNEICTQLCNKICKDPGLTPENFDKFLSKFTLFE